MSLNDNLNSVTANSPVDASCQRKSRIPFIALVLGLLSVIAALSIGFASYDRTVRTMEQNYLQFYLNTARMLAKEAVLQSDYSDEELLALIGEHWELLEDWPDDTYICIVDKDGNAIYNSLSSEIISDYIGDNLVCGNDTTAPCTVKQLIESGKEYAGGYISSSAESQIATYVPILDRQWGLSVHRSRVQILNEVRASVRPLFVGLMLVCGVLMPVSMSLLYGTFQVSRRKRESVEREREELLGVLDAKNNELQSIVYVSSHDLRSPLVNITGFSGMLTDSCSKLKELLAKEKISEDGMQEISNLVDEYIPESVGFIGAGTEQMKMLIDGLLKISRVGTVDVKCEKVDMNLIFSELAGMVSFQVEDVGATLTVDDLPDCFCDENQLKQLFGNLIDNAIKYLQPDRKGLIRISCERKGDKVVYCVEDNGIGIDERHQQKIFEIYHRLDPEGTVDGEGLGLSIIRRILNRHNGNIWIESEPGKGSKFFVSLRN